MVAAMVQMTNSPEKDEQAEYVTPQQASKIAFLSAKSLSRLADEGKIRSIRPASHRRYLRADVEALVGGAA